MPKLRRLSTRDYAGLVLIVAFCVFAPPGLLSEIHYFTHIAFAPWWQIGRDLLVLAVFWLVSASFIASAALSHAFVKWLAFALVVVSFVVAQTYQVAVHQPLVYDNWAVIWEAKGNFGDAAREYGRDLLVVLPWLLPLLFGYLLIHNRKRFAAVTTVSTFIVSIALFVGITVLKSGNATGHLPSATAVYGLLATGMVPEDHPAYVYKTTAMPTQKAKVTNIVLVVDESLRYDFFEHFVKPELVKEAPTSSWHMYDFGLATSMANCSAGSNVMIRKGVSAEHTKHDLYANALIWSYAHNAGFATWMLNAQHHRSDDDYVNATERKLIDHIPLTPWTRDSQILKSMSYLDGGRKTFTLVIKIGQHFPYQDHYPSDYKGIQNPDASVSYVQKYAMRQHYIKAIDYQTTSFLKGLMRLPVTQPTFVIYTSDHGQNLRDYPGGTHCNVTITPGADEGVVPFVIFTNYPAARVQAASVADQNKMSHFDITPILKDLMGYPPADGRNWLAPLGVSKFEYGDVFNRFTPFHWRHVDRKRYLEMDGKRWSQLPQNKSNVAATLVKSPAS